MIIKRGVKGTFVLLILFLTLFSISVSAETGKECSVLATSIPCGGVPISTPGYGAVEICGVCYQCGAIETPAIADGICPEDYSDGLFETNSLKTNLTMRVRRTGTLLIWDRYSVAFNTGNQACSTIGGNCNRVQRSLDGFTWTDEPAGSCSTRDVSVNDAYNNAYFRAICQNVPRKAGCEYCPDPDCKTNLSGFAIDTTSGSPINIGSVSIRLSSENNPGLNVLPNGASVGGTYDMLAVSGELNITCSMTGYSSYSTIKYLTPGRNIVDCRMDRAIGACQADCFITDVSGNSVCDASCDGINGCDMTPLEITECGGELLGTIKTSNYSGVDGLFIAENGCMYENRTSLTCCDGGLNTITYGVYAPGGCGPCVGAGCTPIASGSLISGDVSSILTRDFRRVYRGLPVKLKIITYIK